MLLRVLGARPEELSLTAIRRLVEERIPESQRLEYKSALPGQAQDERREFARDVAAMGNGGGGLIIIGVRDENEVAAEVTPVELGQAVTRLQQICRSLIEPYLRVLTFEVPISEGRGVVVLEIEPSTRLPFAVSEGGRLGYYTRVGRTRQPLSEAEVERLYRDRFRRQAEVEERLAEVAVRAALYPSDRPRAYIAAVPLTPAERLFRTDRATTGRLYNLSRGFLPMFGVPEEHLVLPDARPGFKHIRLSHGFPDGNPNYRGWMEIHADGAYLGVFQGDRLQAPGSDSAVSVFYDVAFVADFLARVAAFGILAEHFDLVGEVHLRAGITGQALPVTMEVGSPTRGEVFGTHALDHAVATDASAELAELRLGPSLLATAKPLLDDLFSAFGWPECLQISQYGQVRARYLGHGWREYVPSWAGALGIELTEETVT